MDNYRDHSTSHLVEDEENQGNKKLEEHNQSIKHLMQAQTILMLIILIAVLGIWVLHVAKI